MSDSILRIYVFRATPDIDCLSLSSPGIKVLHKAYSCTALLKNVVPVKQEWGEIRVKQRRRESKCKSALLSWPPRGIEHQKIAWSLRTIFKRMNQLYFRRVYTEGEGEVNLSTGSYLPISQLFTPQHSPACSSGLCVHGHQWVSWPLPAQSQQGRPGAEGEGHPMQAWSEALLGCPHVESVELTPWHSGARTRDQGFQRQVRLSRSDT